MFGSDILDIAIGLVLVYLIFSILMTSVTEAIEALLKSRAGDLEQAIWQLVQGDHDLLDQFYQHPLIYGLYRDDYKSRNPTPTPAADGTTPTPAPASSMKSRNFTKLPSYIPREVFSAAMIDILNKMPDKATQLHAAFEAAAPALSAAIDEKLDPVVAATMHANSELIRKRRALEDWFDGAMDRASGMFKRRTQVRLFVVGLGIALVCNVNSVVIAQYLATHKPALEAMVTLAKQVKTDDPTADVTRPQPTPIAMTPADNAAVPAGNESIADDSTADGAGNNSVTNTSQADTPQPADADGAARDAWLRKYQDELRNVGLPIGWSADTAARVGAMFPRDNNPFLWIFALLTLLLGYLATAFAVMLGAPFWFDLLGRLMVVRSTVKPDQKSKDDPPITS
jgi:hypothetical protein